MLLSWSQIGTLFSWALVWSIQSTSAIIRRWLQIANDIVSESCLYLELQFGDLMGSRYDVAFNIACLIRHNGLGLFLRFPNALGFGWINSAVLHTSLHSISPAWFDAMTRKSPRSSPCARAFRRFTGSALRSSETWRSLPFFFYVPSTTDRTLNSNYLFPDWFYTQAENTLLWAQTSTVRTIMLGNEDRPILRNFMRRKGRFAD